MNSRRFILFAAGLALSLGQAAAQETNSAPASVAIGLEGQHMVCLLYTSPSPRDVEESRMPSSA